MLGKKRRTTHRPGSGKQNGGRMFCITQLIHSQPLHRCGFPHRNISYLWFHILHLQLLIHIAMGHQVVASELWDVGWFGCPAKSCLVKKGPAKNYLVKMGLAKNCPAKNFPTKKYSFKSFQGKKLKRFLAQAKR